VSGGGELLLLVFILHESTVKAALNTTCEILGGLTGEKAGGCCGDVVRKLGVLTPIGV